jgi:hypothetical protein
MQRVIKFDFRSLRIFINVQIAKYRQNFRIFTHKSDCSQIMKICELFENFIVLSGILQNRFDDNRLDNLLIRGKSVPILTFVFLRQMFY